MFKRVVDFMQEHFGNVNQFIIKDKTEKKKKEFYLKVLIYWEGSSADFFVTDAIKDPIGQVEKIQGQTNEQIKVVSEDLRQKKDVDNLIMASKSDYTEVLSMLSFLLTWINGSSTTYRLTIITCTALNISPQQEQYFDLCSIIKSGLSCIMRCVSECPF